MGRPESPLDPGAGPVQRFAHELRVLRREAGGMTYRVMAERSGYASATLSEAAAGERLPSLPVALAYVGACGGDAEDWQRRWRRAAADESEQPTADGDGAAAPYLGLARFEPGDSARFFGRDRLVADLTDLARAHRFAALVGTSGSGKSSLLRAGLIPALRQSDPPATRPVVIRVLTPGATPATTHAHALVAAEGDGDTWVLVDQFEELFTLCHDAAQRGRFIDLLLTALRPDSRLRVVIGVRADFYGHCAEHRRLADALRDANLLVAPMSRDELREAIVKPAAADGLILERALTARIIADVIDEPGALPLMSHALLETWRRRRGRTLTLKGYEAAAGVRGAIAHTAERLYTQLSGEDAALARRVLLRLITPGEGAPDTRRPARREELAAGDRAGVTLVLEHLAHARLVTFDHDSVDLAHEALITAWPRLQTWIEKDREVLRQHRALTEAAAAWAQLGQDAGALYRGTRLTRAEEAFTAELQDHFTALEKSFLTASVEARRQERRAAGRTTRRLRALATALAVFLTLALTATGLAYWQRGNAVAAQRQALSRQLAAQSTALMSGDSDLASLLAVQAYRTSPTREATAGLYAAAAVPLRHRLTGHGKGVRSVAFSPDGRTLASGSFDRTVRLWDPVTGRARTTLAGEAGAVNSVAFSKDGTTLAASVFDGARVWDATTGHAVAVSRPIPDKDIRAVGFAHDGRAVAVGGTGRLWDVATGRITATLKGPTNPEMAIAFSPDGRSLATTARDHTAQVSDLATGRVRVTLTGRGSPMMAIAFGPDNKTVATGSEDGSVHLWDAATGRPRATLTGHTETVVSAAFSPDGKTLATGSYDGTVRLWDVATEEVRATLTGHTSPVTAVAFSPDGRSLAAGSDDTMATGSENISIRIWDVTASRPLATLTEPGRGVRALAFSPDGRSLATGSHRPPAGPRDRNRTRVRLWNVATRGLKATLAADDRGFGSGSALAFSPDGKTLADAGPLSTRLWDVAAERVRTTLADDDITLDAVVFSPDGQSLATAQHESRARLWDLRTGRARFTTPARPSSSSESALAFSPDGALLAVGGHSLGRVFLQDAVTGETLATLTERADPGQATKGSSNSAKPYNPVGSLAFSPDGTTLAAAGTDGKVRLWDVGARKVRAVLTAAATEGGMSVAFSPDGRTLATGSPEGTVRLWDPVTGYPRAALTGHTRVVTAVAFSPDGRTLASGSNDGTVRLWDATLPDPAEIVDTLCRAIRRDFTHPERLLYLTDQQAATGCAT